MKKFSVILSILVVVVAGTIALFTAPPARALCAAAAEEGEWINYDSNTRSITRINVNLEVCDDVSGNGSQIKVLYGLHLFGSCHPTDCDWGKVLGERDSSGWIRSTIDHGYAIRYVWVKAYTGYPQEWLRVWIWTDFHDPARTDYASNDWFNPAVQGWISPNFQATGSDGFEIPADGMLETPFDDKAPPENWREQISSLGSRKAR